MLNCTCHNAGLSIWDVNPVSATQLCLQDENYPLKLSLAEQTKSYGCGQSEGLLKQVCGRFEKAFEQVDVPSIQRVVVLQILSLYIKLHELRWHKLKKLAPRLGTRFYIDFREWQCLDFNKSLLMFVPKVPNDDKSASVLGMALW